MKNYAGEYLHYLPWYDKENIHFLDMARVIEILFRILEKKMGVVERNFLIDSAIEVLPMWQRDLNLQIDESLSIQKKREIIQAYLHYLHKQTTEEVVQDLCKSFRTEDSLPFIEKAEAVDTYKVVMQLKGQGHHNCSDLMDMLKKVMPAHLSMVIEYLLATLLKIQTQYGVYNYPIIYCGEEICGDVPFRQYEVDPILVDLKAKTGNYTAPNKVHYTGEGYSAGQINDDGSIEEVYMQDFSSEDVYNFSGLDEGGSNA